MTLSEVERDFEAVRGRVVLDDRTLFAMFRNARGQTFEMEFDGEPLSVTRWWHHDDRAFGDLDIEDVRPDLPQSRRRRR